MTSKAAQTYYARLQRVLHSIEEHLEEDLSVETLSGVAAFSKYHFHRQFKEVFGLSVYRYIQLARLKRASYQLAYRSDCTVLKIALESGYEGPEAFARAFKREIGQTPTDFRKQPDWLPWHATYQPFSETRQSHMTASITPADIKIVDFKATRVAVLEHHGDPALIGDSIRRFIAWRKDAGLAPRHSATFNILYSDPEDTPPEDFRLDLCAATERDIPANNTAGIVMKTIPSGLCAVLRYVGTEDGLRAAIAYLYAEWLPQSGEELRDFPPFLQRLRFFPDVPEHEAEIDIFIPLK